MTMALRNDQLTKGYHNFKGNRKDNLEAACCLTEVPTSRLIMAEQKSNYVSRVKQKRTPRQCGVENPDKSTRWPCL